MSDDEEGFIRTTQWQAQNAVVAGFLTVPLRRPPVSPQFFGDLRSMAGAVRDLRRTLGEKEGLVPYPMGRGEAGDQ